MINRRLAIVVAVVAVIAGADIAGSWAASRPERYEAEAVLAVGPAGDLPTEADLIDVVTALDRGGITATAAGIAGSRSVLDAAIEAEGLEIPDLGDYEIDSVPVLDSSIIDLTVSGPDPETAAALANAVSNELQVRLEEIYGVYRVEVLTAARPPSESDRPSVVLVSVAGALLALAVVAAVGWAAFGGRRPVRRPAVGDTDGS